MDKYIIIIGTFSIDQIKEITNIIDEKNEWSKNEELQIDTEIGNYFIIVENIGNEFVSLTVEMISNED